MIRYPLEALRDAMGAPSLNAMGQQLGVAGTTLHDYRDRGLTSKVADRLAIRAGLHPALVWDTWIDDSLTVVDHQFLEAGWRQAWLWNEAVA